MIAPSTQRAQSGSVVEGIIDHHILQIHHVRFGPSQPAWDISFLILGAILAVIGFSIAKRKTSG